MHELAATQHLWRLETGSESDALPKQIRVAGMAKSTGVSKASCSEGDPRAVLAQSIESSGKAYDAAATLS